MQFAYRAMDVQGKIIRGNLDAVNALDLEMRLKRMSLDLVTSRPASALRGMQFGSPISRQELINFSFHLEQLLKAGVPIIDALVDLRDSVEKPHFREVLANLIETIEGGKTLSEALAGHPRLFDTVFVSLVRAGEQSGQLGEVLLKLTENLKWQDEIAKQTRNIVIYPAVTGVVVMGVVFFLMIYLVPKLAAVIRTLDSEISTSTKVLIAVSSFFVNYWYLILAIPIIMLFGFGALAQSNSKFRYRLDQLKLRVPLIGTVQRRIILARFSTFFALMYASGISILDCIRISEKISGNKVIEAGLADVGRAISEGKSLTEGFQSVGLFPPLVLRMLRVGEATGGLDTALNNVSYFYTRDVKEAIEAVQRLIEPITILVIGSILIMTLLPVFGPIYDAISKVKI
ncbi:MAG: type II secretion system F family protein [Pseudomonadota bacterium]|nr:type II secretion system F family protein [Pseudomonadota bacterium]